MLALLWVSGRATWWGRALGELRVFSQAASAERAEAVRAHVAHVIRVCAAAFAGVRVVDGATWNAGPEVRGVRRLINTADVGVAGFAGWVRVWGL